MGKKLTEKQKRFVAEYIKQGGNGTKAAKKAGYSKKTAPVIASENLIKPNVKQELKKKLSDVHEKLGLDAEWVLKRLMKVAERSLKEVPVMEYDKETKSMEQKIDDETGQGVWEFDSSGANRSLELLGKNMRLFVDKVEIETNDQLSEQIKDARTRAARAKNGKE